MRSALRKSNDAAIVVALSVLAILLVLFPFQSLAAALAGSAGVELVFVLVASWRATRGRALRGDWQRLVVVLASSLLLVAVFVLPMSWSGLPLDLGSWFMVHAALQCLVLLGLARRWALSSLVWVVLAFPLVFLLIYTNIPPAHLPVLAVPVPVVTGGVALDVVTALLVLFAIRAGASRALVLPLVLCLAATSINLFRSSAISHPTLFGDLAVHPSRDIIAHPDQVLDILGLRGGEDVVDVGAGGGYYTFRLARAVGSTGQVVATDVDYGGELRAVVEAKMVEPTINPHQNVLLVAHGADNLPLRPESADLVLMSQVTAILVDPGRIPWLNRQPFNPMPPFFGTSFNSEQRLVRSVFDVLRPGGRLVVINMLDDPDWPFQRSKLYFYFAYELDEVIANYEAIGFRLAEQHDLYMNEAHEQAMEHFQQELDYEVMATFFMGRRKFFLVFEKPAD